MKITHHWNIERENGTEYTRFFLDNGKELHLESSTNAWSLKGKTGRAIKNDNSVFEVIKLVSPYFDSLESNT
jgi:hypothetical protein